MKILDKIALPQGIKKLDYDELNVLAGEVRTKIIEVVHTNGGHLASSLGCVEIIIGLLYCFSPPKDKIIFDVGHQAYAYKILTDRLRSFDTLRQYNGVSGFPRPKESIYDFANSGHAGNALAIAIGYKESAKLSGLELDTISVVGDGAFSSGMLHESMNNLISSEKQIIILNDNGYAISKSGGGFVGYLQRIRDGLVERPFDIYGIDYIGVIDGHNIKSVIDALSKAKQSTKSVIVHIHTNKGEGEASAQSDPTKYHNVSVTEKKASSVIVSEKMVELGERHTDLVCVTPAMSEGTGLNSFQKEYPNRFFDVGICEQYAVSFAAGLLRNGMKVYLGIYSTFMQRGLDQLIEDIMIDKLPLKLLVDRAGIVYNDGETHAGIFDIGYLRSIGMTIYSPFDDDELARMIEMSVDLNFPLTIRYSKDSFDSHIQHSEMTPFGWEEVIHGDSNIVVIPIGASMAKECCSAAGILKEKGINITLVNARTINPLDFAALSKYNGKKVLVVEDNMSTCGVGEAVKAFYLGTQTLVYSLALDRFPVHGDKKNLQKLFRLDDDSIVDFITEIS